MRVWLLTNTTYATWLPGNPKGSVTSVRDRREGDPASAARAEHALPGTPYDGGIPGLARHAAAAAGEPVFLTPDQAAAVAGQFRETAAYRGWAPLALAVMANHFHAVLRVEGDPDPHKLLYDLKAYGTRALNSGLGRRKRWWATGGSVRKLSDGAAVAAGVNYVLRKQWRPLALWPAAPGEPESVSARSP